MLKRSPLPEPSVVEPLAVMGGAGRVAVRLADAAGRAFTPRMDDHAARVLAAMLAAGPAIPDMAAAGAPA